jgi:hypothetical protein
VRKLRTPAAAAQAQEHGLGALAAQFKTRVLLPMRVSPVGRNPLAGVRLLPPTDKEGALFIRFFRSRTARLLYVCGRVHCEVECQERAARNLVQSVVFPLQTPRSGSQRSSTRASTAGTSCVSQALRCYIVSVCV